MESLTALGSVVGNLLKERKQTLAIAESSAGGLINAALVAMPGASAYSSRRRHRLYRRRPLRAAGFDRAGHREHPLGE